MPSLVRVLRQQGLEHRRFQQVAQHQRMHGNAVLRQIQRQRLRQPHAAELGRAVAGVVLAAHFAGFGVDLNDAPLNAVADHQAGELAGAEEIAHQVDLQRAVKIPQREIADKGRLGDAGAVDQQVGTAKNPVHRRRPAPSRSARWWRRPQNRRPCLRQTLR